MSIHSFQEKIDEYKEKIPDQVYKNLCDYLMLEHKEELKKKEPIKKSTRKKPSGYLYFCIKRQPGLKDDNPEMSAIEITKKLMTMWGELSDREKKEWRDFAEYINKKFINY